jgi:hypothetical protein
MAEQPRFAFCSNCMKNLSVQLPVSKTRMFAFALPFHTLEAKVWRVAAS